MIFVPRFLSPIRRDSTEKNRDSPKPLDARFGASTIIVLGDPGMGKTSLFKEAAEQEGGLFLEVRRFLHHHFPGPIQQPLYLDALDEVRARTDDGQGVMDQLIGRLELLGKPKLRLSCRAADWFGGLDESPLLDLSADGELQVLQLCPLSRPDAQSLVQDHGHDGAEFLRQAQEQGFLEWLKNPRDILLLLEALTDGAWPESREELFDRACRSLVSEQNLGHSHTRRSEFSTDSLLDAAGYLSACHLMAGTTGWSLREPGNKDFPWLGDLHHPAIRKPMMDAAARRRIFRQADAEQVVPMHRSIAEYLGARFLASRARKGLPFNRIVRLITARDGGVPTDLRGLFGWLSCLAHQHADRLLDRDPLAVVLHGDIASLSVTSQRRLLRSLRQAAERDPYLQVGSWDQAPLAPLATPRLEPELRQLLQDREAPWQMTVAVLDAVAAGDSLPELGDLLLSLARDNSRVRAVSIRAAEAFCAVCSERFDDTKALLQEIHDGGIEDSLDQMRTRLCESLFPRVITAIDVLGYLPQPKANETSSFYWYLRRCFLENLPRDQIPTLLDALSEWQLGPHVNSRLQYRLHRNLGPFLAKVLPRALGAFGPTIDVLRLYGWLSVHLASKGASNKSVFNGEEVIAIQEWLAAHPVIHRELFRQVLAKSTSVDDFSNRSWNLRRCCCGNQPPGYGHLLLELATKTANDEIAQRMFKDTFQVFGTDESCPDLLDAAVSAAQEQPRFRQALEDAQCHQLPPHYFNDPDDPAQASEEMERAQLEKSKNWLTCNLHKLADGSADSALQKLSVEYFNLGHKEDLAMLSPENRLIHQWGEEITQATLHGFMILAQRSPRTSFAELGALSAAQRVPRWIGPFHAGIQLLRQEKEATFQQLPTQSLILAVASYFACGYFFEESAGDWLDIIIENHSDACAEALIEIWSPSLGLKKEHIWQLDRLEEWPRLRKLIVPRLLEAFPRAHPKIIRELIAANLNEDQHALVLDIARKQITQPSGLHTEQFLTWLSVACLLESEEFGTKFEQHAPKTLRHGSSAKRADTLKECVSHFIRADGRLRQNLPPSIASILVASFTKAYPHRPITESGIVKAEYTVPEYVSRLIDQLGGHPDKAAKATLSTLREEPLMSPWHDRIRHTLIKWEQNSREHSFRRPTLSEVILVLENGVPKTAADLFAFVVDHLGEVAKDLRDGDSDGYRMFWNLPDQWKVGNPLPEEICRDRLKERLQGSLKPLGLKVEREADLADHKRADMLIVHGSTGIPVECKRHYHQEIWTGIEHQLIPKYVRDPGSGGFGIYCVFWFGGDEEKVPPPPAGIAAPKSARELSEALKETIPTGYEHQIAVVCVDVSRPSR